MSKEYRINGFEQIKAFYSWIFNNADKKVTPQHISLYLFLVNQNNRSNWIEWFKCPLDLAMAGACIGNKRTYYSCLEELQEWGFIKYKKGTNEWRAPLIKLEVLKCTSTGTSTVPLPTPLVVPLVVPLPTPLPTHIYKLITDNIKLIIDNIEDIVKTYSEDKKEGENSFSEFWDSYHEITGLKKTDMQPAQKYWKQLTKGEKEKALKNIQLYYDSLNDKKYCKKARTYLSAKSYNDEFVVDKPTATVIDLKGHDPWGRPYNYEELKRQGLL